MKLSLRSRCECDPYFIAKISYVSVSAIASTQVLSHQGFSMYMEPVGVERKTFDESAEIGFMSGDWFYE